MNDVRQSPLRQVIRAQQTLSTIILPYYQRIPCIFFLFFVLFPFLILCCLVFRGFQYILFCLSMLRCRIALPSLFCLTLPLFKKRTFDLFLKGITDLLGNCRLPPFRSMTFLFSIQICCCIFDECAELWFFASIGNDLLPSSIREKFPQHVVLFNKGAHFKLEDACFLIL